MIAELPDPGELARTAAWQQLTGLVPRLSGSDELASRLNQAAQKALAEQEKQLRDRDSLAAVAASLVSAQAGLEAKRQVLAWRSGYAELCETSLALDRLEQEAAFIHADRVTHYRRGIARSLPALASELIAHSSGWDQTGQRMRDFFGTSKGLWDLEPGSWQRIDWRGLEEAAVQLAAWPELQELANLLGRGEASAFVPPQPEDMVRMPIGQPEHHVDAIGRSEITGFTRGGNLSLLPAFELALLADSQTEGIFLKRHAEGALTNLEYKTIDEYWVAPRVVEEPEPALEPASQGPVIICADTSGSMAGWPERVAKALTLALARQCLSAGRGCYLIGFSSGIHCFDLSDPVRVLAELSDFLIHGFHGGTDLRPALARSLELLDNPAWIRADLLIISDFRVPKLMIKKAALIDPIRQKHAARLHALTISSGDPSDDLHVFDTAWHFRIGPDGSPLGLSAVQFREQKGFFSPS